MNEKIEAALRLALDAHRGQVRDGNPALPYFTHPVNVLHRLYWVGGIRDEETLLAGILHDTLEDTAVTEEEIRTQFGDRVTRIVREVTRTEPTEAETAGLDPDAKYALRSRFLLNDIRTRMSPEAHCIKLADRLSNLEECLVVRKGKKLVRYILQTHEILEAIPRSVNPRLWDDLKALVSSPGTDLSQL